MDNRDVILGSIVCVRRSAAHLAFPSKLKEEDANDLMSLVEKGLSELPYQKRGTDKQDLEALLLSAAFVADDDAGQDDDDEAAPQSVLTLPKDVRIAVNRVDHIEIGAFDLEGNPKRAFRKAYAAEALLSKSISFAFDQNLGYLTARPRDVGNAMSAAILVHIPALKEMDRIERIQKELESAKLQLRNIDTNNETNCAFYLVATTVNLGKSEEEVFGELLEQADALASEERCAFADMLADDEDLFHDNVLRSYALMKYARIMSYGEFLELYSDLRMGALSGFARGDIERMDGFARAVSPAALEKECGEMTEREECLYRAEAIHNWLNDEIALEKME